jgi:hypothetical protein
MLDVNVRCLGFLLSAGSVLMAAFSSWACSDVTAISIVAAAGSAGAGSDVDDEGFTVACEQGSDLAAFEPAQAAQAMDVCQGLVSARYAQADGSDPLQTIGHGLLTHFGARVTPRRGSSLLALSTGAARNSDDEFAFSPVGDTSGPTSGSPVGFPIWPEACRPFVQATPSLDPFVYDSSALELVLRVPTNARSLSFDFDFFASDFPTRTCSPSSDVFAVLVDPPPAGAQGFNVALDAQGDPISVSSELLQVCEPQDDAQGVARSCPLGASELEGTYYAEAAATGWLRTRLPVEPDTEISLFFAIWDADDFDYDSLVLLDRFTWSTEPVAAPSTSPASDSE